MDVELGSPEELRSLTEAPHRPKQRKVRRPVAEPVKTSRRQTGCERMTDEEFCRIFEEKFADPDYYRTPTYRWNSPLAG